jgi:hypothetical protein
MCQPLGTIGDALSSDYSKQGAFGSLAGNKSRPVRPGARDPLAQGAARRPRRDFPAGAPSGTGWGGSSSNATSTRSSAASSWCTCRIQSRVCERRSGWCAMTAGPRSMRQTWARRWPHSRNRRCISCSADASTSHSREAAWSCRWARSFTRSTRPTGRLCIAFSTEVEADCRKRVADSRHIKLTSQKVLGVEAV